MGTVKTLFCGLVLAVFLSGCHSVHGGARITLISKGASACIAVCDTNSAPDRFAVKELVEIVKASTGVELEAADVHSEKAKAAASRILVGRNALVRTALGGALLDSLKKQESLVTGRGEDLILVGGDDWGTLYAVYDFLENEAGYRNFLPAPGGERILKRDSLRFSGTETRRTMAFTGTRSGHPPWWPGFDPQAAARFFFRNRFNLTHWFGDEAYLKDSGLREEFCFENHCHGFGFIGWEETFAKHPEFFTLNKDGHRIANAELCLSNADCRKHVTAKVLETVKAKHPQGINCYVVASNDNWGNRYCWCPNCLALEKKYNSVGGPLWDYMLELCAEVKKDYPDVLISTLAYKGPQQTEKAPDNMVFPDNFIADCAFLNTIQTLTEIPADTLDSGERFQKFENLLKWGKITKHVSYWFYALGGPIVIYDRPQKELRELRDAGVESIFHCGFGGDLQFGCVSRYVTLRLMIDPDQDAKALAAEAADFFYGAAAPLMKAHMAEMEELRFVPGLLLTESNPYPGFNILKPEQILRWRKDFDKMEALTKDDPRRNLFVRQARTAVDIWTLIFLRKIQKAFPDFKPDVPAIVAKGLSTCEELAAAKLVRRDNTTSRAFESLQLFAYLKNDDVPPELQAYPKEKIIRHLPEKVGSSIPVPDAEAVAAHAMKAKVPEQSRYDKGVHFDFYDTAERKMLLQKALIPKAEIVPHRYKLYKLGTARLPRSVVLVTGGLWGCELDVSSLGRYYDPTYHNRNYEVWISLKFEGPKFDPQSQAKDSYISWDQILLVDKGVVE